MARKYNSTGILKNTSLWSYFPVITLSEGPLMKLRQNLIFRCSSCGEWSVQRRQKKKSRWVCIGSCDRRCQIWCYRSNWKPTYERNSTDSGIRRRNIPAQYIKHFCQWLHHKWVDIFTLYIQSVSSSSNCDDSDLN